MRSSRVIKGMKIAVLLVVMPRCISTSFRPSASEDTYACSCCQSSRFRAQLYFWAMEQKPLPLGVGAERQHRQNFIQRFPLADQFFRRGAVG